jgi:hypothetical protein
MKIFVIAAVVVAGLLAGCAGSDFVRPDTEVLKNGQTTVAQVVQRLGAPRAKGSVVKNGKTLTSYSYAYASTVGSPVRSGVVPARALTAYFDGETLVGHEFVSSWAEDATEFDEAKAPSLVKGTTTRAEVTRLLGKPSGAYVPPMAKPPATDAVVYAYSQTARDGLGLKFFRKVLVLSFDPRGVVTDVDFESSGNR